MGLGRGLPRTASHGNGTTAYETAAVRSKAKSNSEHKSKVELKKAKKETVVVGTEGKIQQPEMTTANKKKRKKKSEKVDGDCWSTGEVTGSREREKVERQLLSLSATTPHTKLLVSLDTEQLWFSQVCVTLSSAHTASPTLNPLRVFS